MDTKGSVMIGVDVSESPSISVGAAIDHRGRIRAMTAEIMSELLDEGVNVVMLDGSHRGPDFARDITPD